MFNNLFSFLHVYTVQWDALFEPYEGEGNRFGVWRPVGTIISGASRMRAGQGICVLRQGILGHFRPLLDIFGAKGLFKDTFLFEGRGCIPPPP